ncbi:hypothetical protein GGR52DRAFT_52623 [Hypoxylon sp. FL1284]|nr:hypothetical protein GGR52DRAFT_52623 [Hypoxylon sp. FL1284]
MCLPLGNCVVSAYGLWPVLLLLAAGFLHDTMRPASQSGSPPCVVSLSVSAAVCRSSCACRHALSTVPRPDSCSYLTLPLPAIRYSHAFGSRHRRARVACYITAYTCICSHDFLSHSLPSLFLCHAPPMNFLRGRRLSHPAQLTSSLPWDQTSRLRKPLSDPAGPLTVTDNMRVEIFDLVKCATDGGSVEGTRVRKPFIKSHASSLELVSTSPYASLAGQHLG